MEGFTLQIPQDFIGFGIQVPGIDLMAIKNAQESEESTTRSSIISDYNTTRESPAVITKAQLVAMTHGMYGCPSYMLPILSILFCIGCLANLLGCCYVGLSWKKGRQNLIFIHLFLANFGSILFIPFTVAARLSEHWYFPNETFLVLSFITSLSQVVVAFQLTFLATLRRKQILSKEEFVTTTCTKVVSFFIWIIGLPIAALSIFNPEILAGTIKSDTFLLMFDTQVLYITSFVFGSLIPIAIILFCVVCSYRKGSGHGEKGKVDWKLQRDISEVMMLGLLYIVCCVPVQILRMSSKQMVNGCETTLNILICTATFFSVLSPILHIAYISSSGTNGHPQQLTLINKDGETTLNVLNEFDDTHTEKDEEKGV